MSTHIIRFYSRPLALTAAALLLHVGSAAAADSSRDVQQQLRDVLAGSSPTQSVPASAPRADRTGRPVGDEVQQLLQRVLLGATDPRIQGAPAPARPEHAAPLESTSHKGRLGQDDGQTLVQRVLLGTRNAAPSGG